MLLQKLMVWIKTALGEVNKPVVCGICSYNNCNSLTMLLLTYNLGLDHFNKWYQIECMILQIKLWRIQDGTPRDA